MTTCITNSLQCISILVNMNNESSTSKQTVCIIPGWIIIRSQSVVEHIIWTVVIVPVVQTNTALHLYLSLTRQQYITLSYSNLWDTELLSHFGDVFPSQSRGLVLKELNLTPHVNKLQKNVQEANLNQELAVRTARVYAHHCAQFLYRLQHSSNNFPLSCDNHHSSDVSSAADRSNL